MILGSFEFNDQSQSYLSMRERANQGRFYHYKRVFLKEYDHKVHAVSLNIFQRMIKCMYAIFCRDYIRSRLSKIIDKKSSTTSSKAQTIRDEVTLAPIAKKPVGDKAVTATRVTPMGEDQATEGKKGATVAHVTPAAEDKTIAGKKGAAVTHVTAAEDKTIAEKKGATVAHVTPAAEDKTIAEKKGATVPLIAPALTTSIADPTKTVIDLPDNCDIRIRVFNGGTHSLSFEEIKTLSQQFCAGLILDSQGIGYIAANQFSNRLQKPNLTKDDCLALLRYCVLSEQLKFYSESNNAFYFGKVSATAVKGYALGKINDLATLKGDPLAEIEKKIYLTVGNTVLTFKDVISLADNFVKELSKKVLYKGTVEFLTNDFKQLTTNAKVSRNDLELLARFCILTKNIDLYTFTKRFRNSIIMGICDVELKDLKEIDKNYVKKYQDIIG